MAELRFGTGGIPLTTKNRDTISGIQRLAELGLKHLELEFVYSIYLKEKDFAAVKQAAIDNDVTLTIHGSYYTNFASSEEKKRKASIKRLIDAALVGKAVGVKSITMHSAFYTGQDPQAVYDLVKESLSEVVEAVGTGIDISPELTGKASQFGDLNELIKLVKDFQDHGVENVNMCIDFAHYHARSAGGFTKEEDFRELFRKIKAGLGADFLKELHMHMSAINFGEKGEKNHLTFLDSYQAYVAKGIDSPELKDYYADLASKNKLGGGIQDWKALLRVMKELNVGGYLVCESPNLEHDALLMQQYYQEQ